MNLRKIVSCSVVSCLIAAGGVTAPNVYAAKSPMPAAFAMKMGKKMTQPSSTVVEEKVVALANKLKGQPYKTGGNNLAGFDAPGFVQYVLKNAAYVNLPKTAVGQMKKGTELEKNELLPGDLVFFKNYHGEESGLYLGKGKFMMATPEKGVSVQNLKVKEWKNTYAGAVRVLQPSDEVREAVNEVYTLAKEGKLPNCEVSLGATREEVVETWGEPDDLGTDTNMLLFYEAKNCMLLLSPEGTVSCLLLSPGPNCSPYDVLKVLGTEEGQSAEDALGLGMYQTGNYSLVWMPGLFMGLASLETPEE